MFGSLMQALRRVLHDPTAASQDGGLLQQIREAGLETGDRELLHLLQVSLRAQHKPAVDLALRRLDAYYLQTAARAKRVSILTQLAHLHPTDEKVRADLESAHLDLGHPADAARLHGPAPARGRAEVVRVAQAPPQEDVQDTLPMEVVSAIDAADTEVDAPPRPVAAIPNDPTAVVDPKTLDLLRRLSS